MKTFGLLIVRAIAFLLVMALFAVVFTYPVKLAINAVFSPEALTAVFGVPYVSFWRALLLSFLTATLFKSAK